MGADREANAARNLMERPPQEGRSGDAARERGAADGGEAFALRGLERLDDFGPASADEGGESDQEQNPSSHACLL